MKAIYAKYISPSNTRGARYKATDNDGNSITIGYDHALDHDGNGRAAQLALAVKMGWNGLWVSNGDVAVCVASQPTAEVISDWEAIERFSPATA